VTRSYSSGVISLTGEKTLAIALLTHTSIGPSVASTRAAAASTCAASPTSVGMTTARPPAASTSRRAPSSPAWPRASSPTEAPRRANAIAVARPTPAEAPVMTTTLDLRVAIRSVRAQKRIRSRFSPRDAWPILMNMIVIVRHLEIAA
jgi:hypothetical protein